MALDVLSTSSTAISRETLQPTSQLYRVVIRLETVRENLLHVMGKRPTDAQVHQWLGQLGFSPANDGNAWIGSAASIQRLNRSEIARTDHLNGWPAPYLAQSAPARTHRARIANLIHGICSMPWRTHAAPASYRLFTRSSTRLPRSA